MVLESFPILDLHVNKFFIEQLEFITCNSGLYLNYSTR